MAFRSTFHCNASRRKMLLPALPVLGKGAAPCLQPLSIRLRCGGAQLESLALSQLEISWARCFGSQCCSSWPDKAATKPAAASPVVARSSWPPQHAGPAAAHDLDEMSDPVVQSFLFPNEAVDRATGIGKPAGYPRLLQQWLMGWLLLLDIPGACEKAPLLMPYLGGDAIE